MQIGIYAVTISEIHSLKPNFYIICLGWFLMGCMWVSLFAIESQKK